MTSLPNTDMSTDALLIQADVSAEHADELIKQLNGLLASTTTSALPGRIGKAALSAEKNSLYAYADFNQRTSLGLAAVNSLETSIKTGLPQTQNLRVSRLERVFDTPGASAASQPVFHYVVEMDPETGWMPELSQWYDTEHMPGLAQVSGCVQASRFLNHDHGPLSLACYDLLTEETLGSPPWLAVRGTQWSSRMRPRFTNTIRTMFRLL